MEKSAKDLAFDKERARWRQAVRREQQESRKKDEQIQLLDDRARVLEAKNREQKEWIERLLDYTGMTYEDMVARIQQEKKTTEAMERVTTLFSFGGLTNSNFRM